MSDDALIHYASDITVRVRHNAAVRVELSEQGPQGPAGDITPAMIQTLADARAARDAAQVAEDGAQAAQAGALIHRNAAETAKDGAEAAKAGANIERVASETSRQASEVARQGSETARTGAQTARTGSEAARAGAEAALGQTNTARDVAVGAKDAAQTAQGGAQAARLGSEQALASTLASEAATAALRDETLDALEETETARDVTFAARDVATAAAQSSIDTAAVSITYKPTPAAGTSLNTVIQRGIYVFDVAGNATAANGFPNDGRTGRLIVTLSGSKILQEYADDSAVNMWARVSTNGGANWTGWAAIFNNATLTVPNQAEAEAGTGSVSRIWTALRVRQAIAAYASPLGHKHVAADITDLQALLDAKSNVGHQHPISDITGLQAALNAKAPLASPALTGTPTAPTAATGDRSDKLATTAFVGAALDALVGAAPGLMDTLDEIAAALGDDPHFAATMTAQLALKSDKGHHHPITEVDGLQDALDLKAPLASPAFTGNPTVPNQAAGTSNTRAANTAFVAAMGATKAAVDHVHGLDDLTDVDLAGAADGQFIRRTNGLYVPARILIADVKDLESGLSTLTQGIQSLNNNAILIDGQAAKLPKGPTSGRPAAPAAGYIRYNETSGKFEGYGQAWGNIGGGAAMSEAPPSNPAHGDLWYPPTYGVLLVRYDDGATAQWVAASPTVDPTLFVLRNDNLASLTNKNAALQNLGGTTLGMAIFKAASAAAARQLLGLRRERIDLTGKTSETINIPSDAKAAKIELFVYNGDSTAAFPFMRFGVGGTIFSGANQYFYNGTWTSQAGTPSGGQQADSGLLICNSASNGNIKQHATVNVTFDRSSATEVFHVHSVAFAYTDQGTLYSQWSSYMVNTVTTALRLDQLYIGKSGAPATNPYAANSYAWIDWLD